MGKNVLEEVPQAPAYKPVEPAPENKISIIGVILAFFLFVTLVLLGERIIFDMNRYANPHVDGTESGYNYSKYPYSSYSSERSGLSNARIYYKNANKNSYVTFKILIHSAFIIPAFLFVFLLYYVYHLKKGDINLRVVIFAYFGFALWMLLHLLGELGIYIIDRFQNAAVYIILIILAMIMTALGILLQKKVNQPKAN